MGPKRVLFVTPSPRKRARGRKAVLIKTRSRTLRRRPKRILKKKSKRIRPTARSRAGLSGYAPPACKNVITVDAVTSLPTRFWSSVDMCKIPRSDTNSMSARCGMDAHVVGFMHRANWRNNLTQPVKVYQFWVVPLLHKEGGLTDAELQADFFTRHGLSTDNDATWTTTTASMLYDEPVNSQRLLVLKKSTFILGPVNTGGTNQNYGTTSCVRRQNMFIKLNKKYTYGNFAGDAEDESVPIQPSVIWISWVAPLFESPTGTSVTAAVQRELHIATYFRDGESGM